MNEQKEEDTSSDPEYIDRGRGKLNAKGLYEVNKRANKLKTRRRKLNKLKMRN